MYTLREWLLSTTTYQIEQIEQNSCVTVKFNAILGVLTIYANYAKNILTALTCKLRIWFSTKFWNFWRITRLSIISRCKVIWSQIQSGFLAHPVCTALWTGVCQQCGVCHWLRASIGQLTLSVEPLGPIRRCLMSAAWCMSVAESNQWTTDFECWTIGSNQTLSYVSSVVYVSGWEQSMDNWLWVLNHWVQSDAVFSW